MTVGSCRNDINACHREDQQARWALDEVIAKRGGKPAAASLTPNGAGRAAAKREWSATAGGARVAQKALPVLAGHAAVKAALHGVEHGAEKSLERFAERATSEAGARAARTGLAALHALSLAAWIKAGVELVTEAHEGAVTDAREQAQREQDGLNRDAMRLFIIGGSGGVFSAGYRRFLTEGVSSESKKVASDMVGIATSQLGASFEAERAVIQAMAKSGMQAARAHGIRSGAELERALAKDPKFLESFEASTAFRMGVGAWVYEQSSQPPRSRR